MSALDEFSYHEALDRASVIRESLHNSLATHVVIDHHPELEKLVDRADDILSELYTAICSKSDEKFGDG